MDIWNGYRFRVVYRDFDKLIKCRIQRGYIGGTAFGTVRLCVYSDKANHWYCIDPDTGLSLAEGRTRQAAVDAARVRLSKMTPEAYAENVRRAKKDLVRFGLMTYSVERGFVWHDRLI